LTNKNHFFWQIWTQLFQPYLLLDTNKQTDKQSNDYMVDWLHGWLITWLIDYVVDWLQGWLITWLIDYMDDWLHDWLITWLIEYIIEWLQNPVLHRIPSLKPSVFYVLPVIFRNIFVRKFSEGGGNSSSPLSKIVPSLTSFGSN